MQYTYNTTGPSSIHRISHMNNGITTVKMGMPFKPNTMAQGNMFSLARAENTQYLQSEDNSKKWYGSSDFEIGYDKDGLTIRFGYWRSIDIDGLKKILPFFQMCVLTEEIFLLKKNVN